MSQNSAITPQGTIAAPNQLSATLHISGNSAWSFQGDRQEEAQQEAH